MKKHPSAPVLKNILFFAILVTGLSMSAPSWSQSKLLPPATQIAARMKVGWNMGNTLEAICGESAWGGAYTTQSLIDSVKAAGFNTVRLPVAWFCHSDTIKSVIDKEWMARVKQVVDYCIKDSLYVIVNMHWDKGWLENRINKASQATVNKRQHAYWTQIASYFKDYDEHLLFAGANEPNAKDEKEMSILLTYYQTFVDAVRVTGGNNSSRTLIIQGPETNIEKTNDWFNTFPKDRIADRMMIEVHYYSPYQFCLMPEDASWGKVFYYWGKGNHSQTDVDRNSTWGEEEDVEKSLGLMKAKFVDKGIPVIIGEYGAYKRNIDIVGKKNKALHDASVEYYQRYVVGSALKKGIIPYYWDTPNGLYDRGTGRVLDRGVLNAIMQGVKDAEAASKR
jgi:endoglucanase